MSDSGEFQESRSSLLASLQEKKLPLWVSLVLLLLLLLLVALFAWKQLAVASLERRLSTETQTLTQKLENDKATFLSQTREAVARSNEEAHRILGTTLSWAVRGELIRGNLDQIDQYFNELVKTERFQLAVLADPSGKVLVATDKKYQNGIFAELFPGNLLTAAQVTLHPVDARTTLLVMPIMGLNTRLGTAVLRYTAPPSP